MKGTQLSRFDSLAQITSKGEVVATERKQIAAVCAFRRRREPEQEARFEVLNQATVGVCGRVMELVDDDVVEVPGLKALEVTRLAECLDRGEQHYRACVLVATGELPHHAARANPTVGR